MIKRDGVAEGEDVRVIMQLPGQGYIWLHKPRELIGSHRAISKAAALKEIGDILGIGGFHSGKPELVLNRIVLYAYEFVKERIVDRIDC